MPDLPLVSVVFISYNRASTLIPVYESFLERTDYPRDRLELLLSDDGSDEDTLSSIAHLKFDRRFLSTRNRGLGANQNKGLKGASGDFIMSLQDDCLIIGPENWLQRAIRALGSNPDVDFLSLLPRPELPIVERRPTRDGELLIVAPLKGPNGRFLAYPYSDQPHLKRPRFHQVAGSYLEGVPMDRTEIDFCRRTATNDSLIFSYLDQLHPFQHIGADKSFNPGNHRHLRIARRETLPIVGPILGWARKTVKLLRRT